MMSAVVWGTIMSSLCSTIVAWVIVHNLDFIRDLKTGDWQMVQFQTFFNQAAIWGAIAPLRFFHLYQNIMWCFLIVFCLPFIPWALNKYVYKSSLWTFINCKSPTFVKCVKKNVYFKQIIHEVPIMFRIVGPGAPQSWPLTALLVAIFFRGYLLMRRTKLFHEYGFVTGAACKSYQFIIFWGKYLVIALITLVDAGTEFAIIAFFIVRVTNLTLKVWNPLAPNISKVKLDYYCFADASYDSIKK